jgi:ADP-ribosylglycohydrolase
LSDHFNESLGILETERRDRLCKPYPVRYGAVIGDICGSIYQFRGFKTEHPEDISLTDSGCYFTDDTVLTVAVTEALVTGEDYGEVFWRWAHSYPNAGYGGGFKTWLRSKDQAPYSSCGNGAAMRISPVGWAFDVRHGFSWDDLYEETDKATRVTHNHPEGVKGARAVVSAIQMSRRGLVKEEIKRSLENEFGYDLDFTLAEIRPDYSFDQTCQGSVPQAIVAFLESWDFESAVQNAISLGGDADTLACIAGSIAEAYYQQIPEELLDFAKSKLPDRMLRVLASPKQPQNP